MARTRYYSPSSAYVACLLVIFHTVAATPYLKAHIKSTSGNLAEIQRLLYSLSRREEERIPILRRLYIFTPVTRAG